jgi:hypothetical protein
VIETLVVLALVGLLAAAGLVLPLVPAELIVQGGGLIIALGAVLGLPTGFWYHVKLRAALARHDELPARWWLRPVSLHEHLTSEDRPAVLRWFYVGGFGFLAIVLGSLAVAAGVLMEAHRAGAL